MKKLLLVFGILFAMFACSNDIESNEDVGTINVALTSIPSDVKCLKMIAQNSIRIVVNKFDITTDSFNETINSLPTGEVTIGYEAFSIVCNSIYNSNMDKLS